MKQSFKAKGVTITPAVETHFEKKLQRLEKYLAREVEAYIVCSREKGQDRVEITLLGAGIDLRAEDRAGDLYSALDLVMARLERQIERYKTRLEQKKRDRESIRKVAPEQLLATDEVVPATIQAADDADFEPHIVRSKHFALKPLDPEEACLQMELLGHSFFVFLNASTEAVNVVYRRNDGNYGLIEPEV